MAGWQTGWIAIVVCLLAACSQQDRSRGKSNEGSGAAPAHADVPFNVTATIKELMDSTVDPSADGVWGSVAIVSTTAGIEERQPRTDEEWSAVRRHAVTLVESANLLIMEGRHAAPAGATHGIGELDAAQIDQRIAASRPAFVQLARNLSTTALGALNAIDARSVDALLRAGGEIDEACEACHTTYWYPDEKRYAR